MVAVNIRGAQKLLDEGSVQPGACGSVQLGACGSVQPGACVLRYELSRERQTCRKLVPQARRKVSTVTFTGSTQYSWDGLGFSTAHSRAAKCSLSMEVKSCRGECGKQRPEVGRATRVG